MFGWLAGAFQTVAKAVGGVVESVKKGFEKAAKAASKIVNAVQRKVMAAVGSIFSGPKSQKVARKVRSAAPKPVGRRKPDIRQRLAQAKRPPEGKAKKVAEKLIIGGVRAPPPPKPTGNAFLDFVNSLGWELEVKRRQVAKAIAEHPVVRAVGGAIDAVKRAVERAIKPILPKPRPPPPPPRREARPRRRRERRRPRAVSLKKLVEKAKARPRVVAARPTDLLKTVAEVARGMITLGPVGALAAVTKKVIEKLAPSKPAKKQVEAKKKVEKAKKGGRRQRDVAEKMSKALEKKSASAEKLPEPVKPKEKQEGVLEKVFRGLVAALGTTIAGLGFLAAMVGPKSQEVAKKVSETKKAREEREAVEAARRPAMPEVAAGLARLAPLALLAFGLAVLARRR